MALNDSGIIVHAKSKALWIGKKINIGDNERFGSMIGGLGLVVAGLSKGNLKGLTVAAAGSYLMYRGLTGHCNLYGALGRNTAAARPEGVLVDKSIEIDLTPEELYRFWLNFENLPRFMEHVEAVWMIGDHRYHWVAKAPAGMSVEWDAEVIMERSPDLIAWRSLPGADIPNEGSVRFEPGPIGLSTIVHVSLRYYPPAGRIGAWVASLFGEEPSMQIEHDLQQLKDMMEGNED